MTNASNGTTSVFLVLITAPPMLLALVPQNQGRGESEFVETIPELKRIQGTNPRQLDEFPARERQIRRHHQAPALVALADEPEQQVGASLVERGRTPGSSQCGAPHCDETGYLPIDRQAATLFFQLISQRYERGPMIDPDQQPELRELGRRRRRPGDRERDSRPDPASRDDADDGGSVSGGLWDAAVPVDALRATTGTWTGQRTACPRAPTGVVVVVGTQQGVGEFSMTTPGEIERTVDSRALSPAASVCRPSRPDQEPARSTARTPGPGPGAACGSRRDAR